MTTPTTPSTESPLQQLLDALDGAPRATVTVAAVLLAGAITVADALAPAALPLGALLVVPVALGAWSSGALGGRLLAAGAALAWLASDTVAGGKSPVQLLAWGLTTRLLVLFTVAELASLLSASRERERLAATTDALTGLLERRAFFAAAGEALSRAREGGTPVTLACVDVDDFKVVNATYGSEAGDQLLRTMATTVRSCVRASDLVARLDGDELGILLPGANVQAAQVIGDKLEDALFVAIGDSGVPAATSIGLASREGADDSTLEDLLRRAEAAMYHVTARRRPAPGAGAPAKAPQRRTADAREGASGA